MGNESPVYNTKVTTDNYQPAQMAKETCLGFREHDRGNRKKAITHFAFVDKLQFSHLDETEAQQAATAYVNALFAKDDVEIQHLRRIEEKASRFSAGMNPTLPFTLHQSMAQRDIPR